MAHFFDFNKVPLFNSWTEVLTFLGICIVLVLGFLYLCSYRERSIAIHQRLRRLEEEFYERNDYNHDNVRNTVAETIRSNLPRQSTEDLEPPPPYSYVSLNINVLLFHCDKTLLKPEIQNSARLPIPTATLGTVSELDKRHLIIIYVLPSWKVICSCWTVVTL